MPRKRGAALILIGFFLLGLAGCMAQRESLELPQADWILLCSGSSGASVEVRDQEDVRRITEGLNALKFQKGYASQGQDPGSYTLTWYGSGGEELDSLTVMTESRILYRGFSYASVGGGINTPLLDQLLEGL